MEGEAATVRERGLATPAGTLARGAALERYVILDLLGEGGMGVVYAAYDYALDRKVAIKLVTPAAGEGGAEILLAEAKAMAKLAHPAIVAVHDVGEFRGQVFIAMEYVEGETLRVHLATRALDKAAKLALLRDVGEGLATAHRGGIVHRDFKPDNVLIARDGRPKIADFGLAKSVGPAQLASPIADSDSAGTPGYMSPEQHLGEVTDAATDQYAYCITVIEAFTGEREIPSLATLGEVMPRRIARAVLRGTARKAADRWPSMDALLAAIAPRRRRFAVAGLAVILSGAVIATLVVTRTRSAPELDCERVAASVDTLWSPAQTAALASRLRDGGAEPALAAEVERSLSQWAAAWRQTAKTSCDATRAGTQDGGLHAMRMHCLELARARLDDTIAAIVGPDAEAFGGAVPQAVQAPPDLGACQRDQELLGWADSFPEQANLDELMAAQRDVYAANTLAELGRNDLARPKFLAAIGRARALKFAPLVAEAYFLFGASEAFAGRGDAAANALFEAISIGEAAGAGTLVTNAWIRLVFVQGLRGRPGDAIAFAEIARARVRRNPGSFEDAEITLDGAVGALMADHGRAAEALPFLDRQLAYYDAHPEPVNLVSALQGLAGAHMVLGHFDQAVDLVNRALSIARAQLPAEHAAHPTSRALLVQILVAAKRGPELLVAAEAALAGSEPSPDDPVRAANLRDRGYAHLLLGRLAEARADLEPALATLDRLVPADDPDLARARYDLALLELAEHHAPRAVALLEQAIAGTRAAAAERRIEPAYVPEAELEAALASARAP